MALELKITLKAITAGLKSALDGAKSKVQSFSSATKSASTTSSAGFKTTLGIVDRMKLSIGMAAGRVVNLNTKVKDMTTSSGALGSAMKGFAGLAILNWFKNASVEANTLARGFKAVTGSVEGSEKELAFLKVTAGQLGLPLREAGKAYLGLAAAAKGTSLEGQASRDIFTAVSLAMGKLGKSSADTEGALLAIQQMISKGKVSAEELRGQLGERLPGAFQAAASAIGVTTAELDQMLVSGKLTAEELLPKLTQELNRLYDDGTKVKGFEASWNRLKNSIDSAFSALDQSGGYMSKLGTAMEYFGSLVTLVSIGLVSVMEYAKAAAVSAVAFWDAIWNPGATHTLEAGMKKSSDAFAEAGKNIAAAAKKAFDMDVNLSALGNTAQKTGDKIKKTGDKVDVTAGQIDTLATSTETMAQAMKDAGIEIDKYTTGLDEKALKQIQQLGVVMENPALKGEALLGFLKDLEKNTDSPRVAAEAIRVINMALEDERITTEQAAKATEDFNTSADTMTQTLRDAGIEIDKYTTGLDSKATQQIKQLGVAMENPAFEGKPLLAFLKDLAQNADNPRVVTEAIRMLGKAVDDQRISVKDGTAALDAMQAALDRLNKKTDDTKTKTTDLHEQMYALAKSYRETKISAKEFYDGMNALGDQLREQRRAADKVKEGNQGIKESAEETAKAVEKAEEEQAAVRQKGLTNFANFWKGVYDTYHKISAAAGKSYDDLLAYTGRMTRNYGDAMKVIHQGLEKINAAIKENAKSGIETTKNFRNIILEAQNAIDTMEVMDATKLNNLKQQIIDAKNAMADLNDTAQETLSSLREELAQLNGDTLAVENMRYQKRLDDLRAQLAEAQASGATEAVKQYEEAINTLNQIHNKTVQNLRNDQAAQAAQSSGGASGAPSSTTPTNAVEITFRGSGPSSDAYTGIFSGGQGAVSGILDILEEAGART